MQPPSTGQQPFPTTVAQASLPFSTGQATSMPAAQASVPSPTPSALQAEDLYAYQKCTIMIVVQLRPQVEDGRPRSVLLPKFGPKKWQRMAVSLKEGQTVTEELWKGRAREGRETLERDVIR